MSPRLRHCLLVLVLPILGACATTTRHSPPAVTADSATLAQLQRERGAADTNASRSTIAVTPFSVSLRDANLNALGFALADLITTDLSRSARLQLVERSRLGEVLQEQDLVRTGRIDSSTAPRVGRILRANQLVLGSLDTLPGGDLRLGIRLAEVESGLLHQALDARAPLQDVLDAEKALVLRLFESLGITLTPGERAQIDESRTSSVAALSAYGRGVQAELGGDRRRALDEYERALRFDPSFLPPAERMSGMQSASPGQGNTALVPSARTVGRPISGTVDRLNRPLDLITSIARPSGGPGDPAFPSTIVTVLLRIRRP